MLLTRESMFNSISKLNYLDTRDNVIKYCTSSAFFEVKSLDASNKFIGELYNKAILHNIY